MTPEEAEAAKKAKQLADPVYQLLTLWQGVSIEEIQADEFVEKIKHLQAIRRMKIRRTKPKSPLTKFLAKLDQTKSRTIFESYRKIEREEKQKSEQKPKQKSD